MKLGKEALLAITESALFILGAFFFLLVFLIPSNPIWALIVGILFGLAGAILWSCPHFVHLFGKASQRMKVNHSDVEAISKKIQGDDDTYELHRANSYENYSNNDSFSNLADEFMAKPTAPSNPEPSNPINDFRASFHTTPTQPTEQPDAN